MAARTRLLRIRMNGTSKSERRPRGLRSLAGIVVFLVLGHVTLIPTNAADTPQPGSFKPAANVQDGDDASAETSPRPEFDGEFAYEWLKKICNLGPRVSGSEGMKRQQEMLQQYFQELRITSGFIVGKDLLEHMLELVL